MSVAVSNGLNELDEARRKADGDDGADPVGPVGGNEPEASGTFVAGL